MTTNQFPECQGYEGHLISTGCIACISQSLSLITMDRVESWWLQGIISSDARRGYLFVWTNSAVRSKMYDHFRALPDTNEGREYAREIGKRIPSGRGYC